VDECGHLGDLPNKIKGIEDCDARLIKVFLDEYRKVHTDKLRIMVLPDHPVPVKLRKHTRDPVPFMVCGEGVSGDPTLRSYNEATCAAGRYRGLRAGLSWICSSVRRFPEALFRLRRAYARSSASRPGPSSGRGTRRRAGRSMLPSSRSTRRLPSAADR